MSDRPQGRDWWLASDGKWYPPEVQPGRPQPDSDPTGAPRPDAPPLSPGLVAATQATLLSSAGLAAFGAVSFAMESGDFDEAAVRSAGDITEALGSPGTVLGLAMMAMLLGSVLLIIWMYQAHRAAGSRGATGTTWSPGWAIGSWFIPIANLVLPKLVVGEIDRMSHPDAGPEPIEDRWKRVPAMMVGHWWWALTLVSGVLMMIGFGMIAEQIDSFTLDEQTYRAGLQATGAALGLWAGAGLAGALMVSRIGGRLTKPPADGA